MPERRAFTLSTPAGRVLHGLLDLPDEPGPRPAVVDCHGFKGFMEWGFHPYLAELLSARGLLVVRFNFTSAGMRPGDELVTDEDAFARGTFGEDAAEIQAVLAALSAGELTAAADPERLALLGHSRGGGTALLSAAAAPWRDRLKALVTWAAVGTFDRVGEKEKEQWRRLGALPVVNARTGQHLRLDVEVLADREARAAEYDLPAAAARRTAPWLQLHGDLDETVPVAEGRALAAAAGGVHELHVVAGGSHTFGAQHPFAGPTRELIEAMNATQLWLRRYLGS
ncbi:MAG: prolyl oligopeptidase family serine peptidase [Acidobacteriota bacterium]|nr:prolyl oligopeptidase family serine peptidase [Acidobacteriota bacterium]MDH3524002.1 prolyl oligopeptidase family serine peptidase [Acidobacteriota bacterium]